MARSDALLERLAPAMKKPAITLSLVVVLLAASCAAREPRAMAARASP
jgi:hypothetical protein